MATPTWRLLVGDVREKLRELPDCSVQMVCTSPPYWAQREYGVGGQIGLEARLDCLAWAYGESPCSVCYVCALRSAFSEVLRVLRGRGTVWLNIGDTYPNDSKWGGRSGMKDPAGLNGAGAFRRRRFSGLKAKDLGMVPARVTLALQADGWYVRRDVIWHKPNARPEGAILDRPTTAHEYVWMLAKSPDAFYDAKAIGERASERYLKEIEQGYAGTARKDYTGVGAQEPSATKRRIIDSARRRIARDGFLWINARSVWVIPTEASDVEHYAVMPSALAERCIKAGSRPGDTVLDPFCGSGTTGQVAIKFGRSFIGIELNGEYARLAERRISSAAPLFATGCVVWPTPALQGVQAASESSRDGSMPAPQGESVLDDAASRATPIEHRIDPEEPQRAPLTAAAAVDEPAPVSSAGTEGLRR